MSLKWTVSHRIRLVVAVAHGEVEALDMMSYLSSIDEHKAQGYRKLFDLSELDMEVPDEQVLALASLIKERPAPAGPIAVVVADNEGLYQKARTLADVTGPSRLIRVFHRQHLAQLWLDQLGGPLQ
jgi:CheY-like chemotaxis protein